MYFQKQPRKERSLLAFRRNLEGLFRFLFRGFSAGLSNSVLEFKLEPTMLMLCPLSKQTTGACFQTSCIRVPLAFSWTFQERVLPELQAFCSATLTTSGRSSITIIYIDDALETSCHINIIFLSFARFYTLESNKDQSVVAYISGTTVLILLLAVLAYNIFIQVCPMTKLHKMRRDFD